MAIAIVTRTSDSSSASTTNAQNPLAQSNNRSNTHPPPIALPTNTSSFSFASMNQPLMVKLDSWNYLVWKNQLQNVIIANGLDNFIYGSCPCLARFLDVATNHQSEVLGLATIQATSNELVVCLPIWKCNNLDHWLFNSIEDLERPWSNLLSPLLCGLSSFVLSFTWKIGFHGNNNLSLTLFFYRVYNIYKSFKSGN